MNNKISISIIAFILMIGVASADAPILLTTSNNPELNGIVITVTPDGANGKMAVELTSNPVINTPIRTPDGLMRKVTIKMYLRKKEKREKKKRISLKGCGF